MGVFPVAVPKICALQGVAMWQGRAQTYVEVQYVVDAEGYVVLWSALKLQWFLNPAIR